MQTPPAPPPASRARMWRTAWYVIIACLLGLTFIPLMSGLGYVLAWRLSLELNVSRTHPVLAIIALVPSLPLSYFGLYEGARNSFAKKPVYPRVVAWTVGLTAACIGLMAMPGNVTFGTTLLLSSIAGAWGMCNGAKRGARNASMLVGIGDLCAHCGYDLSATPAHQLCPECGGTFRFDRAKCE